MDTRETVAIGLFVLFGMSAVAASQPEDPSVKELVALEKKWIQAENSHDAGTLRTILDERFIAISAGGVQSREEFISNVTEGPVDPTQTQTPGDRVFLVDDDTAVVSETDTVRGTKDGKPLEFAVRVTTTYIRRNGKWRAFAGVFSKAPPPK